MGHGSRWPDPFNDLFFLFKDTKLLYIYYETILGQSIIFSGCYTAGCYLVGLALGQGSVREDWWQLLTLLGLGVAMAVAVAVVAAVMGCGHARGAEHGRIRGRGREDTGKATQSLAEARAPTSTGTGNTIAFSVTKEYKVQEKNRSVNLLI